MYTCAHMCVCGFCMSMGAHHINKSKTVFKNTPVLLLPSCCYWKHIKFWVFSFLPITGKIKSTLDDSGVTASNPNLFCF